MWPETIRTKDCSSIIFAETETASGIQGHLTIRGHLMKKLILFAAATMLFASNANAVLYNIFSTVQNGAEGATGFGSNLDGYGNASTSPTLAPP